MERSPDLEGRQVVAEQGDLLLESEILGRIRQSKNKRITFAEFMDLALYHAAHGYYSRVGQKLGPRGDFYTSPEAHPVFGVLVGQQLEQMWQIMGRPERFTVVEMGAGSGAMCYQIWQHALASEFCTSLRYIIVEKSADLASRQREKLRGLPIQAGRVAWFEPANDSPLPRDVVGCFLSNELVDAFPVHRVTVQSGRLREIFVGEADGKLVEVVGEPSTPDLEAYFGELSIRLDEGCVGEVNLKSLEWLRGVGDALSAGFVVTIDYGFAAEELYSAKRRQGTLMCYYRHTHGQNPYMRVGKQDMTAHVDFTSLIRTGRAVGLKFTGMVSQGEFLTNLGLEAYMAALDEKRVSSAAYYNNRFAMRGLANPDGLGRFKVLVQHKGLIEPALDCFNPCNDRKRKMAVGLDPLKVPLMEPQG